MSEPTMCGEEEDLNDKNSNQVEEGTTNKDEDLALYIILYQI